MSCPKALDPFSIIFFIFAGSKPLNWPQFWRIYSLILQVIHIHSPAISFGVPVRKFTGGAFASFREDCQVTRAIAAGDTIGREVEDNAKARRRGAARVGGFWGEKTCFFLNDFWELMVKWLSPRDWIRWGWTMLNAGVSWGEKDGIFVVGLSEDLTWIYYGLMWLNWGLNGL